MLARTEDAVALAARLDVVAQVATLASPVRSSRLSVGAGSMIIAKKPELTRSAAAFLMGRATRSDLREVMLGEQQRIARGRAGRYTVRNKGG